MHFGQPSVGTSGPRLERQNCRPSTIWIFAVALFLLALTPATSSSVPIYFDETGHYYDFVQQSQISWSAANSAALAMSYEGEMGCLATITRCRCAGSDRRQYVATGVQRAGRQTAEFCGLSCRRTAAEKNWQCKAGGGRATGVQHSPVAQSTAI